MTDYRGPLVIVAASINRRLDTCWQMAAMFLENRDAHGLHDSGVEIQALERALTELKRL